MTGDTTPAWQPGQKAVIDRRIMVTIDRVTPGGRAIVGTRTFAPNGRQRGVSIYHASKLEPLTPEVQAAVEMKQRGYGVSSTLKKQLEAADHWRHQTFPELKPRVPTAAEVDKAKRLMEAIRGIMEES